VGDEYSGAHDAEEGGDCFQHGNNPKTQRPNLTAAVATQSKGFRDKLNFESLMMILCNRLHQPGTIGPFGCGPAFPPGTAEIRTAGSGQGGLR
jgi:hypothetical protein